MSNLKINFYSLLNSPLFQGFDKKNKLESSMPAEFKWAHQRVTYKEILELKSPKGTHVVSTEEEEKAFTERINKLVIGKNSYDNFLQNFINCGYTKEESQSILTQAIHHTKRACDWAHDNEKNSGLASRWIFSSIPLGIIKNAMDWLEVNPFSLKHFISIAHNFTAAMRGVKQFTIYGERADEDRAENLYEAEKYGNKVSGLFANLAYLFETKINWLVLPVLSLFGEKAEKVIKPLLSLPNILWWRIRMPAEINQKFATDILNCLIHKPLSFFGSTKSTEKLKEINPDNLSLKYINKRLRNLIGLDEKKDKAVSILSKLNKEIKSFFKGTDNEKISSSIKINKLISPLFGFYGFFTALIGTPLNSFLTLIGKENRFAEAFNQTSCASQQLIYFFRLMLPEYLENKKIKRKDLNKEEEKLKDTRNTLFYTGATVCGMNILSTALKLFKIENKDLKFAMSIYDEIADKGIPYFLSWRRHVLGAKFRFDNPELFEIDGRPKVCFKESETKEAFAVPV